MGEYPLVELVYDQDCPNIEKARSAIAAALRELGVPDRWTEWDRAGASTPTAVRHYGSPTVLVNRQDVGCGENEDTRADANACRVYVDDDGCLCGVPATRRIVAAIRAARPA